MHSAMLGIVAVLAAVVSCSSERTEDAGPVCPATAADEFELMASALCRRLQQCGDSSGRSCPGVAPTYLKSVPPDMPCQLVQRCLDSIKAMPCDALDSPPTDCEE